LLAGTNYLVTHIYREGNLCANLFANVCLSVVKAEKRRGYP